MEGAAEGAGPHYAAEGGAEGGAAAADQAAVPAEPAAEPAAYSPAGYLAQLEAHLAGLQQQRRNLQQQLAAAAAGAYQQMSAALGAASTGVPLPAELPALAGELVVLQGVRQYLVYVQVGALALLGMLSRGGRFACLCCLGCRRSRAAWRVVRLPCRSCPRGWAGSPCCAAAHRKLP